MKFTRFTSVLSLSLCAALAACDAPTSISPLASHGAVASNQHGKPETTVCRNHWQELKTAEGGSLASVGDCIKYSAQGGVFQGTPALLGWGGREWCDGANLVVETTWIYVNGSGTVDIGNGPQPYTSGDPFITGNSIVPFTLTVTNSMGQVFTFSALIIPLGSCG